MGYECIRRWIDYSSKATIFTPRPRLFFMLSGPTIILTLKVLVAVVSVILVAAIWAIATGRQKLHGKLNTLFFILTMTTVVGFELLLRLYIDIKATFTDEQRQALRVHLYFAIPSAVILPIMMFSGVKHRRKLHTALGVVFVLLWIGTFITGVFFLPHG
jgi:uncharacterized membrane protein YozB (DUF420 family)